LGWVTKPLVAGESKGFAKHNGPLSMSVHAGLALVPRTQVAVGFLVFDGVGK
jgi:hypothetical protein